MRLILAFLALAAIGDADEPLLLQKPTLIKTHIVFAYAGDLWSVLREGGDAVRLTGGTGNETDPAFSADGTRVAFTGEYDGNVDVFVVPASVGAPKRLTTDRVIGWTCCMKKPSQHDNRRRCRISRRLKGE
jgi:tricorn protease